MRGVDGKQRAAGGRETPRQAAQMNKHVPENFSNCVTSCLEPTANTGTYPNKKSLRFWDVRREVEGEKKKLEKRSRKKRIKKEIELGVLSSRH